MLSLFLILLYSHSLYAQSPNQQIKTLLTEFFLNYQNPAYTNAERSRLVNVTVDEGGRQITIEANAAFAMQPFTRETVERIRSEVQQQLPQPYNTYKLQILANGSPIEELVPLVWNPDAAALRSWGETDYRGNPWVSPLSVPKDITRGLAGRHIALWASHGRYYDFGKALWKWQRPRLFCTSEDIFTQSFVVPFLIPMLEQAGAVVYTPRERDWQREEVIVDGDMSQPDGLYTESSGTYEWKEAGKGFAHTHSIYFGGENPFEAGTSRKAEAQNHKRQTSQIVWQPRLPRDGQYAVYVSYTTLPTSVSDAEYTVHHRGIATKFRVNQQMGGGTWVYLGTFDFQAGLSSDNCVVLTNHSNYRGVVTADAVRFGGGMGNIARGDSLNAFVRSGLPRYLEGSRYFAQWAGMPYNIYRNKEEDNDYAEDINVRSLTINRMARGSVYLPGDSGLCVPLELSLAIHSDAGYREDLSHLGTLGIYTTGLHTTGEFEGALAEGLLPSGRSRLMSRDLCDMVMTQVDGDIRRTYGTWNRRQMYDRNYSETRLPEVPSMILETLSHQNFADLLRGHDPAFKMLLSRSIYKGLLKYIATVHALKDIVVQPLPVADFAAEVSADGDSVTLSWSPQYDTLEASAAPTSYIVYRSVGSRGYDNGLSVPGCSVTLPTERGELTRYFVRAANDGGTSMPSEELCTYVPRTERHRLLIVNGFSRLAGPQPVDNDSLRGFDFDIDPGVVYQRSASYCGRQYNMQKGIGEDFGQSGDEFEGLLVAGNTFDFPTQHARDFLLADSSLCISSCSASALSSRAKDDSHNYPIVQLSKCQMIDLILGAQRRDGYSTQVQAALPTPLCQTLADFAAAGGSLLVSGAYIGEEADPAFASQVLHCSPMGSYALADSTSLLTGMNTQFSIYCEPNEERYSVRRLSTLAPTADAFCSVASASQAASLAVAHQGTNHRTLTYGFPLECIREPETRRAIMGATLSFLLTK